MLLLLHPCKVCGLLSNCHRLPLLLLLPYTQELVRATAALQERRERSVRKRRRASAAAWQHSGVAVRGGATVVAVVLATSNSCGK